MQQSVLGAACTLPCHPEDDHHYVYHQPAAADGEVQGQLGGQIQVNYKQPYVLVVPSLCLQNLHLSENCAGKLKHQFNKYCHAGVQFQ